MRQKELRELIQGALESVNKSVDILKGSTNPQQLELLHRDMGRADAFGAVLEAMKGNKVWLKIMVMNSMP